MRKLTQVPSARHPAKPAAPKDGRFAAVLLLALVVGQLAFGQAVPPPLPIQLPPPPAPPPPVTVPVPQVLTGHVPPQVATLGLTPVGLLAATQQLNLAIVLPLRDQQGLTDLLAELRDPESANYRRFLTADEFAQAFGPAESDYAAVIAFAQAHNLVVTGTHPNRTIVDVSGSAADVEQAFHVDLLLYQHPFDPRLFRAPDAEPSVDLPVPLLHICGLDDFTRPVRLSYTPTGSGVSNSFIGYDFRAAYVPNAAALTGVGETVAILEIQCDYYQNDITAYETTAGLPNATVYRVQPDGYTGSQNNMGGGANVEASMDVEMAISMAPSSSVAVYEGWGPLAVVNRIATDNIARQISSSWSGFPGIGQGASFDQAFQQFAAQGQSFLNSSGDSGAYNYSLMSSPSNAVPWLDPMEDSWVTAVGGTELTTTGPGGGYASETTWNQGNNATSGGGYGNAPNLVSSAIPPWQAGVPNQANQASTTNRNFPDVALTADDVYVAYSNGLWTISGGTSAASPLWAGFVALVNQQAAANGFAPVGFLNPALYEIGLGPNYAKCFHDITTGNNSNQWSQGQFNAVQGYDLCTGWGSPTGTNLMNELIKVSDGALGCGRLGNSPNNWFAFIMDFGASAPASTAYLLYSTNVAAYSWATNDTLLPTQDFWTYVDTSSDSLQPEGFYLLSCGTNCWRPTGYLRTQVPALGWALVANQLDAPMNTLNGLFNPMPDGTTLPNGTQISVQTTSGSWTFTNYTWNAGSWSAGGNTATLSPGQGFWVTNASASPVTITFAGLVRQGSLTNQIPHYERIYSSMVPQAGRLSTDLGYVPKAGDEVYIWDLAKQTYDIYSYSGAWSPSEPSLALGQSFALVPAAANTWPRTFSTCGLQ
jgi:hypothetical protein